MGSTNTPVDKLKSREGYADWCFAMRAHLKLEGLWEFVEDGNDAEDYSSAKAAKAEGRIVLCVEKAVYPYIKHLSSAKEMWDELAKVFRDNGLCRRVCLLRKFTNISLSQCQSI